MIGSRRAAAATVALTVLVAAPFLLTGLGRAPFDDPGEGMHVEIAREMRASGDPLLLTLNGVRYVEKPPLLYALLVAAFAVGGYSEAPARAVSALAALAALAATGWLGARLLGLGGGIVAGLALLTSVGFFAYARYVRPETLFVAALASGFAFVLTGLAGDRRPAVVAGLALFGVAGLAKDVLGLLAPPLAIGLALTLAGRARPVARWLPWPGVLAALVLGLGWWAIAELRTPGATWYTVVDNHVLNVARARHFPDEDVPLGASTFLTIASFGAMPWIIAAGAAVLRLARQGAWRDPRELPWVALALWAVGVLGLTALSPFRLPHYGLPAYPAVALLAAREWQLGNRRRLLAIHAIVFAALAVTCAVAWRSDGAFFVDEVMHATDVAVRKSAAVGNAAPLPPWEAIQPLVGTAAIVFGGGALLAAIVSVRRLATVPAALSVALTMLAILPSVAIGLERVASHRAVRGVALEIARHAGPEDVVAHEGPIENSGALEWYSARRPVIVDGRRSVLGFGASLAHAPAVFWNGDQLRQVWESGRRVWIVTTRAPEQSLVRGLRETRLVTASAGRRLYVNQ